MNSLNKYLELVLKKQEEIETYLNNIQSQISLIEVSLQDSNVYVDFEKQISEESDTKTQYYLAWNNDPLSKKMRLMYKIISTLEDGSQDILYRPLIEGNRNHRLKLFKYIEPFLKAYADELQNEIKNLRNGN